jgi:hypothetical protein
LIFLAAAVPSVLRLDAARASHVGMLGRCPALVTANIVLSSCAGTSAAAHFGARWKKVTIFCIDASQI